MSQLATLPSEEIEKKFNSLAKSSSSQYTCHTLYEITIVEKLFNNIQGK